jgi:flagellar biosynthesis protein
MSRPDPRLPGRPVAAPGAAANAAPRDAPAFWPQQAAIALAYGHDDAAPRVLAKGRGLVAQAIIERAHQHGVYVHESRELVSLLMQVDIDQRIPPELYRAVAELLVWVYRLEQAGQSPAPAATGEGDLGRWGKG